MRRILLHMLWRMKGRRIRQVSQRIRMPYIPHGDLEFFNEKAPFRKSKGFYSALKACVVIP